MSENTNGFCGNGTCIDNDGHEIKIPVPWGSISGKWWGNRNVQPVVAIHGWQDNAGTYDTLAPLLVAQGISLFCIDLPGHGRSSHYPKGNYYYIFWDGLHILRRIVHHFKWEKIKLMGHSLGGGIAFLYAAVYPNEIDRYISIDSASPTVRNPSKMIALLGHSIDRFLKYETLTAEQVPCYSYDEMIDVVENAYMGSVTRESCEILMKRGMNRTKEGEGYHFARDVRLKVSALGFFSLDQALEFASRIKCEVLVIRANPGMVFDKPEYYSAIVDKIREHAKRFEYHVVPGTHHIHLNEPESIADCVINFLK